MQPNDHQRRRPTLRDVAQEAGVSIGTVSVVLTDRAGARVADATRARIWAAIDELGFRPNLTARQLRTQQTHTIGFLTDTIASTPFAGRTVAGAHDVAWHSGRLLFLVNSNGEPEVEQTAVRLLVDRRVDGLIYAAQSARAVPLLEEMRHVPTVLVNAFADGDPTAVPCVLPDEAYGGALAVQRLIDAGHRRIHYLAGDSTMWATSERVLGVRGALRAARLPHGRTAMSYGQYTTSSGYARAMRILAEPDRPTALLCANDRVALGAVLAAHECGLRVPGDVSLVGYDDQEELAEQLRPSLTTVSLPHFEMGSVGVRSLLEMVAGVAITQRQVIKGALIERESVAPPSL